LDFIKRGKGSSIRRKKTQYRITNDHGCVSFVENTISPFLIRDLSPDL